MNEGDQGAGGGGPSRRSALRRAIASAPRANTLHLKSRFEDAALEAKA